MKELKKVGDSMYRVVEDNLSAGWVSKGTDGLWYVKLIGQKEVVISSIEQVKEHLG